MPYFFYYLLKVIICSTVLFAYYHLFLRNKVYHAYNRFYLLASTTISLIVPFINFNVLFSTERTASAPIQLLQVVNSSDEYLEEVIIRSNNHSLTGSQWMLICYSLVSLILLLGLIKLWVHLYGIIKRSHQQTINNVVFVESNAKGTPFSFFRFIFWNNAIDINSVNGKRILTHEIAHVKEKHSYDKLYINFLLIFFWINPIFWFIKKELSLIHEFIADKKAIEDNDAGALAAMIIQSAYPHHSYLLSNHFFYSPVKRRLKMLSKYKNSKAGYFYRILALPVVLFLIAVLTIKAKSGISEMLNPSKKITVVIDAGHGGTDGGATASDNITMEKAITLSLVNKIKELNTYSNINLVFTRETDVYQHPKEKAAISRAASPDLFISIHAAISPGNHQTKWSGLEVFVARDSFQNSFGSKLFASSLIQQFNNGNYKLAIAKNPIQSKNRIHVLQALECPSVLIEAGYLNNPGDFKYLQSEEGQNAFAKNVLAAIAVYAQNMQLLVNEKQDTIPSLDLGSYKGVKITGIMVKERSNKIVVSLINGKKITMTAAEAQKEGIIPPPPPPPPVAPPPPPPLPPPPPPPPAKPESDLTEVVVVGYPKANGNEVPISTDASHYFNGNVKTINGEKPTIILEGKAITYEKMKAINPNSIDRINVLKGVNATNKYGDEVKNGVIEIFLKGDVQFDGNDQFSVDGKILTRNKGNKALYIGVENILHITGNTGKVLAVLSNEGSAMGNISNASGKWIAKFTSTGNAVIRIMDAATGKTLSMYNFLVEKLTDETKDYNSFITTLALNEITFTKVEESASFPGGTEAWTKYLQKKLKVNTPLDEGWAEGTYRIIVQFTVDINGTIDNISTLNYKDSKTAQTCIDLIKNGPKWIPARQNGRAVRSIRKQPITFVIEEQDEEPKPSAPITKS